MDKSFEDNDVLFYAKCSLVRYSIDKDMCVFLQSVKKKKEE